ncbi:hypothetical protein K7957_07620 [Sphingomonas yunnanensis]|uniref:hypothetical protein n=1 Tax=Sphingomonas yunnanensis TaxID=310400 RepID=UPI001CA71BD0|nr:hypothetical protein [Sphingomonas yunnanensis]MBY9062796.1 hypothetical protein [Sphingomonas yunnanensis]
MLITLLRIIIDHDNALTRKMEMLDLAQPLGVRQHRSAANPTFLPFCQLRRARAKLLI